MNEQKIEDIKNSLRELMMLINERGQPLSEEMKLQLMKVMEHAADRISTLKQEEQVPPAAPEELPLAPHESSQINGFQYDPESGKLQVQFHGKYPQAAGSVYEYDDVPAWVYDLFQRGAIAPKTSGSNRFHRWEKGKSPSHGASMNAAIKAGGFSYRKVA